MPVAAVNGTRLNYIQVGPEQGSGHEDLVLVHGLATNLAFWYFPYVPQLAQRFRVTLFDLRGHGRSAMPAAGYTPHELGQDLCGLLDHLGIQRAHFLAHSFGGVAVLSMACRAPERVSSLILADTHLSAARHADPAGRWEHAAAVQALLDAQGLQLDTQDPYFGYRLLTAAAHLQLRSAELPAELLSLVPLMGKVGQRTATQWLRLMDCTAAEAELLGDDGLTFERLHALRFPILAMYGDQSQARLTGAELLEVWPHAEFRRVRDAGHFFPATRPAEVMQAAETFWDGRFSALPRHRAGELRKSHFRSDRVFEADGLWYGLTREATRVGPFARSDDVREYLSTYIASMATPRS